MNEALVVLVRSIIGFFSLIIFARVLGKQQISQLTFFDYVLGITIGSTASTLTTDLSTRAWPHWVGLLAWCLLGYLMQIITLRWRYTAKYIDGQPIVVIMDGKIMEQHLKKIRYRMSDVMEQLRSKGVFDLSEVQCAILESDGELSILKKPENNPVTLKDLKLKPEKDGINIELIYDGQIVEQNLKDLKKDEEWLKNQLRKKGIKSYEDVFIATVNPKGDIYVDTYKDKIKKLIDIGDYRGPY